MLGKMFMNGREVPDYMRSADVTDSLLNDYGKREWPNKIEIYKVFSKHFEMKQDGAN